MNSSKTNSTQNWQADTFWQWSLKTYANPGVKDACLYLQDKYGCHVNLLLLCMFTGLNKRALSVDDCAALMRSVEASEQALRHFRETRKLAKKAEKVRYQSLLAQELALEKKQQSLLMARLSRLDFTQSKASALAHNVVHYFSAKGLPKELVNEQECSYLFDGQIESDQL